MAALIKIISWISVIGKVAMDTIVVYAAMCYIGDRRAKHGCSD